MKSEVRDAVIERDRGLCVWCLGPGAEVHHRRLKGMGGSSEDYDHPANLAVLCSCHALVHGHSKWARHVGLIVSRSAPLPSDPFVREPWMPTVEQFDMGVLDVVED